MYRARGRQKSRAVIQNALIFDTHAHVLSPDRERYPYSALRGGAMIPLDPVIFTVDEMVRAMDLTGVDHACLVQRATLYGYDNRYALDAVAHYPDRFVSVIVLDGQDPASPAQLRALVREHNVAGLRIVAPGLAEHDTDWLESEAALALWSAAADLGLPVTIILYRRNNAAGRAALLRIARRFTLPILIDHVGLPHASTPERAWASAQGLDYSIPPPPGFGIADNLAAFDDLGHVHFKVTDINFDRLEDAHHDAAAFVRALVDRFGAGRLSWGSDVGQSPVPYVEKIGRLTEAAALLDADERGALFGGTAYGLYGHKLAVRVGRV
jgi:predicted TIM-barrel fold metal-dependent hydrolase